MHLTPFYKKKKCALEFHVNERFQIDRGSYSNDDRAIFYEITYIFLFWNIIVTYDQGNGRNMCMCGKLNKNMFDCDRVFKNIVFCAVIWKILDF